ncbi:hypothetical protein GEMRC1_000894 [Eukaryota sp. GEM-RC1]
MDDFFCRLYLGHTGTSVGHEFIEFELRDNGNLLYRNNSGYKREEPILREVQLSEPVVRFIRNMIVESHIVNHKDSLWPRPDRVGKTELEIVMGDKRICFVTTKINTVYEIESCDDQQGLFVFFELVEELKILFNDLIHIHFRKNPLG